MEGVSNNHSNKLFISQEKFDKIRDTYGIPQKGDILLTSVGTLGIPYYVLGDHDFYFKDGNLTWFRDFNGLDSKWFYYWIQSHDGRGELKKCEIGSSQKAYTIKKLSEMEFPNLDNSYQSEVATVVSNYDDLIKNNEKRIKILEEMAQRLYTQWFVNFKFPDHEKVMMVDSGSECGMVPEGWEVKDMGSISKEIRNQIDPNEISGDTPYVGLEHIPRMTIILHDWGTANEISSSKLSFNIGDILFGKIRPYFHKVVYAPICGIASSDTIILHPENPIYRNLVLFNASSKNFVDYATMTSQGAKMPRADWKVLKAYKVIVPPEKLLNSFNNIIDNKISLMNLLVKRKRNLTKTRDLLIENLVTGKRLLK